MRTMKWLVMAGMCLGCCCKLGCTTTDTGTLSGLLAAVNSLVELVKLLAGVG